MGLVVGSGNLVLVLVFVLGVGYRDRNWCWPWYWGVVLAFDVDIDVEKLMDACMSGSEVTIGLAIISNLLFFSPQDCPSLEDAVKFLQHELDANLDDETIAGIYKCAPGILAQLGFARK